ncbi:hypothetical protein [Geminicoccus flavidas]|uniref:hypothetical protein n=1 Tax=Geminicoccus flavidas TaxID=2506407 RepID=UPI00135CCC2F|nr:hypothetical protein [Geminicoccus flavidas]
MMRTAAFVAGLLWLGQAEATTLPYLDMYALVQGADGVVEGTVESVVSARSDQGQIFTYVTLRDLEIHTGSYGQGSLTLMLLGGSADAQTLEVVGAPAFEEGQRVVAFVASNGTDIVPLVGWEQGLFVVPQDGRNLVTDSVGNRILDVEDGRIEKEQRYGFEAQVIEPQPVADGPGEARSGSGQGGSRSGTSDAQQQSLTVPNAGQPMAYDAFIQSIQGAARRVALSGPRQTRVLNSVQVGATLQAAPPPRAMSILKAPGQEAGAPARAPLPSEAPGSPPAGPSPSRP